MKDAIRKITFYLALLITISGTVIVINQTIQFSTFMDGFHPIAGDITFGVLITLYLTFILIPIIIYFRLPKRLELPEETSGEEFDTYLKYVGNHLSNNENIDTTEFKTQVEIEAGLTELDEKCYELVKKAGSKTFLFTSISQFGALDTLIVLATQTRLIWDIAHLYNQRPTLRDMWMLYSNVVTTTFIAGNIDEIDFAEILQPVISKALGSAGAVIPGSALFINSLFTGTTNAFLMLRVGLITRNYCNSLVKQEQSFIRKNAIAESLKLLSVITAEGGKNLSGTILKAAGKSVTDTVSQAGESFRNTGKKIAAGFKRH